MLQLGNLESCYFDTYYLPKHCCRPRSAFHGSGVTDGRGLFQSAPWHEAKMSHICYQQRLSVSGRSNDQNYNHNDQFISRFLHEEKLTCITVPCL